MENHVAVYVANHMKTGYGAAYIRIVKALASGIESGELRTGLPMPSQRELARHLGLHFTTVTRAWTEARKRGLISTQPGLGTVIAASGLRPDPRRDSPDEGSGVIDLSSVWSPVLKIPFDLSSALVALGGDQGIALFSARTGRKNNRVPLAAIEWLQPRFSKAIEARVVASAGARAALIAMMRLVVGNGGTLLTESMTWPTIRSMAGMLNIRLSGVTMDNEGLVPAALEQAARETGARALYCVPTSQNPTNAVMSIGRRKALAEVAIRLGLTLFEDDAYGQLVEHPLPPLAEFAPASTYYIAGLTKCLSPSMRVAYVVAPSVRAASQLDDLLRTTMLCPAPIEEALVNQTMADHSALRHITKVRAEARLRMSISESAFAEFRDLAHVGPLFIWLKLPAYWHRAQFVEAARTRGVIVSPADIFAVDGERSENAIRIATGSAPNQSRLFDALQIIADIVSAPGALSACSS
ncbi:aminotransferase-like domain-containing protein [Paraburkholderia ferrariae]|uniref:aminotransferase-like domain-containing protein n=1 Tax=Paraburkholderia ferrariae TaxID=386056 RepID=UPI000486A7AD|nr:PLP-dependent aminotransferase family protein [Paraburkholderia ferrariae]